MLSFEGICQLKMYLIEICFLIESCCCLNHSRIHLLQREREGGGIKQTMKLIKQQQDIKHCLHTLVREHSTRILHFHFNHFNFNIFWKINIFQRWMGREKKIFISRAVDFYYLTLEFLGWFYLQVSKTRKTNRWIGTVVFFIYTTYLINCINPDPCQQHRKDKRVSYFT